MIKLMLYIVTGMVEISWSSLLARLPLCNRFLFITALAARASSTRYAGDVIT